MKHLFVLMWLLCMITTARADEGVSQDVVYGHRAGMALVYDVYRPAKPNGAGIIFVVSYGWFSPWSEAQTRAEGLKASLDAGFTVFMVNHASAPHFKVPDAASDIRAAVRHIKRTAIDHKVDPARLGIWGASAGGHLALLMGLDPAGELSSPQGEGLRRLGPDYKMSSADDASVAAVVAYFPPVDMRTSVGDVPGYPALNFPAELAPSISPILFVTAEDPPTLMIHGDADKLVPLITSQTMAAEMSRVGVLHEVIVIQGGDHGFSNAEHRASAAVASLAWFTDKLAETRTAQTIPLVNR